LFLYLLSDCRDSSGHGNDGVNHGVDLNRIEWVSFEEPHVAEYKDLTVRAAADKNIVEMLLDGELDAVIGETSTDPRLKPLFPDPDMEANTWYAKHRVVPVNHFVVVSKALHDSDPEAVREIYRLLKRAKELAALPVSEPDSNPFGIEAIRPSLELIIAYAAQQNLIPRRLAVEELFSDLTLRLD